MHRVSPAKKNSYTSNGPKKKFLQAENPPSPHHFSNGGSLKPSRVDSGLNSLLTTTKSKLKIFRFVKRPTLKAIFSNSLIIHQLKTKEIITVTMVWICNLN